MKSSLLLVPLFSSLAIAHSKWYPLNAEEEAVFNPPPYSSGDQVPIQCMKRNIDSGEHISDSKGNILFELFPSCKETGKSMALKYETDEDFVCTISLPDEQYHLFQYYVHEDAPFSCKIPVGDKAELFVPLTFNLRGHVAESHIDVDPSVNVLSVLPHGYGGIVSSVAWSSSTNTTRVVIGDELPLHISTRWVRQSSANKKLNGLPYADGFYRLPRQSPIGPAFYIFITMTVTCALSVVVTHAYLNLKAARGYQVRLGTEGGISKRD
ncbi:unnamed protein product [Kuraishia capsulata CBS 1993]|uniref:Protein BIG1 n=1 Tax=Kuraishia capsulata CBS 1993 TaxID=1382522 RepID=W6MGS6_9ASCO|nr:uncharacterized protein KUCA_T00000765001 [Kuraishia capsulata CBS 1993]CDK24798.1 unnamed protein product [Kuraishia capsulata CBS 1993]